METRCTTLQELLVEGSGRPDELPAQLRAHLAVCRECEAVASSERALAAMLDAAVPPLAEPLERAVLTALPPRRLRRGLWSLLPVAVSLLLAAVGAAVAGGVPGGSLLTHLPEVAGHGALALLGSASEWAVAMAAVTRTVGASLPVGVTAAAALLALVGFGSVAIAIRRWAPELAWRRER